MTKKEEIFNKYLTEKIKSHNPPDLVDGFNTGYDALAVPLIEFLKARIAHYQKRIDAYRKVHGDENGPMCRYNLGIVADAKIILSMIEGENHE